MATIQGKTTVKFNESSTYVLQANGEEVKNSVVWKISTVLPNGQTYQEEIFKQPSVTICFNNTNTYDLRVSIEVSYTLKNGKARTQKKEVLLLCESGEKAPDGNPAKATPDTGCKSVVVNTPDDKKKEDEDGITLKLHVYFDGTFGNRVNIDDMNAAIDEVIQKTKPDIHSYTTDDGSIDYAGYEKDVESYKKELEQNKGTIKDYFSYLQSEKDEKGKPSVNPKDNASRAEASILKYLLSKLAALKLGGIDPTNDMISYTQVYTNIPVMFDVDKTKKTAATQVINVYIEGVGTLNGKRDDLIALADGSDDAGAGIKSKLDRAFSEIEKSCKELKNNFLIDKSIKEVEVCVIGFSRGAATSRNFVGERDRLVRTLRKYNSKLTEDNIKYKFVGIFDTVCSVTKLGQLRKREQWKYSLDDPEYNDWLTRTQRNNIKNYKLGMYDNVEEVVHLVAADEYRLFYPLTNIQTSIDAGCGFELVLPGSHCDLGGGDAALIPEKYEEEIMNGEPNIIPKFLMDGGWFDYSDGTAISKPNPEKDTYRYIPNGGSVLNEGIYKSPGYDTVGTRYELKRTVTAGYNRIPLSIMLHYAKTLGLIEQDETSVIDNTRTHKDLMSMKEEFLNYAIANHGHKHDTALLRKFEQKYKSLRKNYLHISAVEDGSFIIRLKNMTRTDANDALCRAIFNDGDTGVSFLEYYPVMVGRKVGQKVKEVKDKVLDTAKEKAEEVIGEGVDEIKKAVHEKAKGILKKYGRRF